jgi:hypothetical protein
MNPNIFNSRFFIAVFLIASVISLQAGTTPASSGKETTTATDTRYGLFGLLDHRSSYGEGIFPEPFLNDDSNLEVDEFRADWLHTGVHDFRGDELKLEIEKGFGVVTLEAAFIYNWESTRDAHSDGAGNVELGARTPVFQFVSPDGFFDSTFGVAAEVAIQTNTPFSQSTEFVPKVFNDLRLGTHLTVQTLLGYSLHFNGDEDGIHVFEYGVTVGYSIPRKELPIPGVQQIIPVFEVSGERQVNKSDSGVNSVTGMAGIRINLNAIGRVQPRWGFGYVFPLNDTAREDLHWGVFTSLVFEY